MWLLNQVRAELRLQHYSYSTEKTYLGWIRRFLDFHEELPPEHMIASDIVSFLNYLATYAHVSTNTQKQAANAIKFLFTHYLKQDVGEMRGVVQAKQSEQHINVLTIDEVEKFLSNLSGTHKLAASLIYGAGMRISEVSRLRIRDINFDSQYIMVQEKIGSKYRLLPLPSKTTGVVKTQITNVKNLHDKDLKKGFGSVYLPKAIETKYPNVDRTFAWQYLFPSRSLSIDPRTGHSHRHRISDALVQKAFSRASRDAGITMSVNSETLRRSFAVHMLFAGSDMRTVKEILGYNNAKATKFYRQLLKENELPMHQTDFLPTPKRLARLASENRLLRSGLTVGEIKAKRWSLDDGDYSIYCLAENGGRIRYIGITSQAPEMRLRQHIADCGRGKNLYKENWIRSCVKRGIPVTIHVVRTGLTAERAGMMEVELIRFFKKAFSLVNTHAGGSTGYAGLSEESKEKHRINTEKGLNASIRRELESIDMARGYCILEEWGWD